MSTTPTPVAGTFNPLPVQGTFKPISAQQPAQAAQPAAQPSGMVPLAQSLADNSAGEGLYQMQGPDGQTIGIPHSKVDTATQNGYKFAGEEHFNPWWLVPGSTLGQKRMVSDEEARYSRNQLEGMAKGAAQDPNTRQLYRQSGVTGLETGAAREAARTAVGIHDIAGKVGIGNGQPQPGEAKSGIRQFAEEPHQGLDENVGAMAETGAEFLTGQELLGLVGKGAAIAGKAGAEGLGLGEQLKQAQQLAATIEKNPMIGKYIRLGIEAAKQGAVGGAQTFVKTGGDAGAAATTGAVNAGTAGVLGAAANKLGEMAANRATTVENIGGVETPIPAEVRNQKPTPQQAAGQESIAKAAQSTTAQHLAEMNETRTAPATAPGLPARTGPFEFNLRGLPDQVDASERGSVVRGNPSLVPDNARQPLALPAPEQTAPTYAIKGTTPVEGREGQIAHSAAKAPQAAFKDPRYTTSSAPTRTGPTGEPSYRPGIGTNEGSTGSDISTARTPEAQSDVARGGGVLHTQDVEIARGQLDTVNRAIADPSYARLPAQQKADLLQARREITSQIAEAEANAAKPAQPLPRDASQPLAGTGMRLEHQPAQVEPAVNPAAKGSGTLRTQDPNIVRAHIHTLNEAIDSPDFENFAPEHQQELIEARRDAQRQLGEYHEQVSRGLEHRVYGNEPSSVLKPVDIQATVRKVGSFTDAADTIEKTATEGYELINDQTGGKFNAIRQENKDAWNAYMGASGEEAQEAARKAVDATTEKMTKLLDGLRGVVDDRMLDGMNDAYRNAQGLRKVAKAVDSTFTGNTLSSKRSWEYRGFDGSALMKNLSQLQQEMGTARLKRLIGEDNLNTLFQVAELNRTGSSRSNFGQAVSNVAGFLAQHPVHVSAAGIGAAAGYHATGDWRGAAGGAAIGAGAGAATGAVMRAILTNPKIANQLIYALKYGAKPENYGPFIANLIQKSVTDSAMEDRQNAEQAR